MFVQPEPQQPVIDLQRVDKSFPTPGGRFEALKGVSFQVHRGELLAITGKSGSGKSTLLNLIAGIDQPTAGEVRVAGRSLVGLEESPLARWRGENVGIVFQFFQLVDTLTVAENVMLPMDLVGRVPRAERRNRAMGLLEEVGVADQADKRPATLSGGQQQRAAIARALANDPPLLIADEPTGNLDSHNAAAIFAQLRALAETGTTVVVVTHERDLARTFPRRIELADGEIVASGGGPEGEAA